MQWPEGMLTKIQAVAGHWNSIQVSCLEHVTISAPHMRRRRSEEHDTVFHFDSRLNLMDACRKHLSIRCIRVTEIMLQKQT